MASFGRSIFRREVVIGAKNARIKS